MAGAAPTLGGMALLSPDLDSEQRVFASAVLILAAMAGFILGFKFEKIATFMRRTLPERLGKHSFAVFLFELFVIFTAFIITGTIAGIGNVTNAISGAVPVAVAVSSAGTAAGLVLRPFGGLFAGAGAVALAVVVVVVGSSGTMVIVFFVLLPIANSALDWLSWAVSRLLLADLLKRDEAIGMGAIFIHAVADLAAAVFLLAALSVVLPFILQAANAVLSVFDLSLVEWWDYLAAARREPEGEGLLVIGMLFSTLLPTAGHFLAMMFALVFPHPVWLHARWVGWLTDPDPDPSMLQRLGVIGVFAFSTVFSWCALVLFAVVVYAALSSFGADFGSLPAQTALWSGGLFGPVLPPGAGLP